VPLEVYKMGKMTAVGFPAPIFDRSSEKRKYVTLKKLNPVFLIVTFLSILNRWTNGQLKNAKILNKI
jgi:hypothetical protein